MNIGEKLLAPREGETQEAYAERAEETKKIFSDALDNANGHKLLRLLIDASHPMAPRFAENRTAQESAFIDGQKDLIGFLALNGTCKPIL